MREKADFSNLFLYTDGAIHYKSKVGGWGFVLTPDDKTTKIVGSGSNSEEDATGNRMELRAAQKGLEYILDELSRFPKLKEVELVSDSNYVVETLYYGQINHWKNNDWVTSSGAEVANQDIWLEIDKLLTRAEHSGLRLHYRWVRGHSGNYFNEFCDRLAVRSKFAALNARKKSRTAKAA